MIKLVRDGDRARVELVGFLGNTLFGAYRRACEGHGVRSRKVDGTWISTCALADVPGLRDALQAGGFAVEVAADLAQALTAKATAVRTDVAAARSRAAEVDAALRTRGLALFAFQRAGVDWLAPRTAALLADQMGLGKTVQALVAAPAGAPVLVIAPAAVKGVWSAEAARFRPDLAPAILSGRGSFRWPAPGEVVITNPDILPGEASKDERGRVRVVLPEALATAPQGCVLIVDEAHWAKDGKAQRTRRLRSLRDAVRAAGGRIWLLTGTPLLNRPPELWGVLEAADLARDAFGSWQRFMVLFRASANRFGGTEWGRPNAAEVAPLLQRVSLRREREAVLPDLPPKTRRNVEVNGLAWPPEGKDLADAVGAVLEAVGAEIERLLAEGLNLEAAIKAAMATADTAVQFEDVSRVRAVLATAKIPAMLAHVEAHEEEEDPLVVFSAHRAPIDALRGREGWAVITGDESAEQRTAVVEAFQAGRLRGVALTIQAGGVGLTLTRAHSELFVDCAWTPALNEQAEDRCCRIGQHSPVTVTRLVAAHAMDRRVAELLGLKEGLIAATVDASTRTEVADEAAALEAAAQAGEAVCASAPARPARRGPETAVERWAAEAIVTLSGLDPDGAAELNGVGWNKLDGPTGHSLAAQLQRQGGLTPKQWALAIRLANRYPRQVGRAPQATEEV